MSLGLDNELQMQLQVSSDYFQPRLIFDPNTPIFDLCFIGHVQTSQCNPQNDEEMFLNRERENLRKPESTLELPLVIEDQQICIIWELGKILL